MMSKCFAVEYSKHDVTGAKAYGQLIVVYETDVRRSSIWSPLFGADTVDKMAEMGYQPEEDYLVVAGNNVVTTLVVAELITRYGSVHALFFSAAEQRYIARRLGAVKHHV